MYKAFISYSHAADGKLAPALQVALEGFAKPWYKVRYFNVFRDETNLSASPHLWTNIQTALEQSDYFIYLASPAAAASKWVQKEIDYWLHHKPIDKILIALTEGKIVWSDQPNLISAEGENSLPDLLRSALTEEPFYIDLRQVRTAQDLSLHNPIFKKEVLKLAAPLHGKEPKDLASEEVAAHRKLMRVRNGALAVLLLLFIAAAVAAVIAYRNARDATEQKNIAIRQRNIAESNFLMSEAQNQAENDPTLALRLMENAIAMQDNPLFSALALKTYRENFFYKIICPLSFGHTDAVFLQNGKSIASGGADGIALWDLAGQRLQNVTDRSAVLTLKAVSPDGKYFFVTTDRQVRDTTPFDLQKFFAVNADVLKNHPAYVRMLDVNGNMVQEFTGHTGSISCAAVSPDGRALLTGSLDSTAILWNLNGTPAHRFHVKSYVNSVAFSPDGRFVLIASIDQTARLFTTAGNFVKGFTGDGIVNSAVFSPDGQRILAGLDNNKVLLWDITGKLSRQITGLLFPVRSVAFSPTGNCIAAATGKKVLLWNVNGQVLGELKGDSSDLLHVAFAPNGEAILTSSDNSVRLWDLFGKVNQAITNEWNTTPAIAFSPDGRSLLTWDILARTWDLGGKFLHPFNDASEDEVPSTVLFSPDGRYLLTNYVGFTPPRLWTADGQPVPALPLHSAYQSMARFSPDGKFILVAAGENQFELVQPDGKVVRQLSCAAGRVNCLAFSPDGRSFLTGSENGTCILWDLEGRKKRSFHATDFEVQALAFSPDGRSFVTGSSDKVVRHWSIDGTLLRELKGHLNLVTSVAFSPDGKRVLSGSWDRTAKLWDLNGNLLQEFNGHLAEVETVLFSRDGQRIATSSRDGVVRLWQVQAALPVFLKSPKIEPLSPVQKKQLGIRW